MTYWMWAAIQAVVLAMAIAFSMSAKAAGFTITARVQFVERAEVTWDEKDKPVVKASDARYTLVQHDGWVEVVYE